MKSGSSNSKQMPYLSPDNLDLDNLDQVASQPPNKMMTLPIKSNQRGRRNGFISEPINTKFKSKSGEPRHSSFLVTDKTAVLSIAKASEI